MRSTAACFAGLALALLAAGRLPGEVLELPAELPLGADSQLFFELGQAEIHLTSRADGVPVIHARTEGGEKASLEVISRGGSLTLRRAGEAGGELPRLRIDGMLGPGRTVRVEGGDLTVRIEDPALAPEEDVAGRLAVHLVLDGSRVNLSGTRSPRFDLKASSAVISHTTGALALTLAGGSVDVRSHRGSLELDATGAAVAVADHQGRLTPRLAGGSLQVAGGSGSLAVTATGAELSLDGWRGDVEVRADDSTFDARGSQDGALWQLAGRGLRVTLEEIRATIGVTVEAGSLQGRNLQGTLQAAARDGSSVELVDLTGQVTLELAGGAEGWITHLAAGLEAELTDSRLTADGVRTLALTGTRADVVAGGIEQLGAVEMKASQLHLDLREIRHEASLDLQGPGRHVVQLSAPCIVLLAGATSLDGAIEVAGCELRPPGQQVSRQQDRERYGESRPSRLTVTLGPGAGLEVEGEP